MSSIRSNRCCQHVTAPRRSCSRRPSLAQHITDIDHAPGEFLDRAAEEAIGAERSKIHLHAFGPAIGLDVDRSRVQPRCKTWLTVQRVRFASERDQKRCTKTDDQRDDERCGLTLRETGPAPSHDSRSFRQSGPPCATMVRAAPDRMREVSRHQPCRPPRWGIAGRRYFCPRISESPICGLAGKANQPRGWIPSRTARKRGNAFGHSSRGDEPTMRSELCAPNRSHCTMVTGVLSLPLTASMRVS